MKRLFAAIFLICGLTALAAPPPAQAGGPSALTDAIKQDLMALNPLRGGSVDRAFLDGKPLLVVFFASW